MSDNRFSSASPGAGRSGSGSNYGDYFAGPASSPSSTFGGGPGPTGVSPAPPGASPFGTPAPAHSQPSTGSASMSPFGAPSGPANPGDPFGAPGYPAGRRSPGGRRVLVAALAAAVIVLTGAGFIGYRVYEHNRPVVMPATLGGLPASANPAVRRSVTAAQNQLRQENPNIKLEVQAYGVDSNRILIAAALRGTTTTKTDLASFGNNIGTTQQVGNSTCATSAVSHVTVCERSSNDLTVIAASVTRAPAAGMTDVSALVDQIWGEV